MADVDFFFDPICPWAWITSRWVTEVTSIRKLEVAWRFISLKFVNPEDGSDNEAISSHNSSHVQGLKLLRVAAAVRAEAGNTGVERLYSALGAVIHVDQRREDLEDQKFLASLLSEAGLNGLLAAAADNGTWDDEIASETELALTRAGRDVGTPVITFAPPDGPSFFGPVISRIPRGEEAIALWEATELLARFPGFAELKRSVREFPQAN